MIIVCECCAWTRFWLEFEGDGFTVVAGEEDFSGEGGVIPGAVF